MQDFFKDTVFSASLEKNDTRQLTKSQARSHHASPVKPLDCNCDVLPWPLTSTDCNAIGWQDLLSYLMVLAPPATIAVLSPKIFYAALVRHHNWALIWERGLTSLPVLSCVGERRYLRHLCAVWPHPAHPRRHLPTHHGQQRTQLRTTHPRCVQRLGMIQRTPLERCAWVAC